MTSLPASLRTLVERFDPTSFDAPRGEVRIRLAVTDRSEQWDVIANRTVRIAAVDPGAEPAATLAADVATWEQVANDLRGGMDAYRAGRLIIRRDLNLGVGFLAATSGATGPGRIGSGSSGA